MKQNTSYGILIEFRSGIKKRYALHLAMSTFRHWKSDIEYFMSDSRSLPDARKVLKIARDNFPQCNFKLIKSVVKTQVLDD